MTKKGRVCIYCKEHIPLIKRDDIYVLDNCLVKFLKIFAEEEKYFLTSIYRFPSQSHDEFHDLCTKFDLLLSNINHEFLLCSIATGDFNACCSIWSQNEITNSTGQEIDSSTSSAEYRQMIDKPTHVVNDSMSCIGLLFCTNQNTILN